VISKSCWALALFIASGACFGQSPKDFVRIQSAEVALEHVRVIDGTGAPAKSDQTIVIAGGKIAAIEDSRTMKIPSDAKRFDFTGYSALPGLVGMHDHLFYSVNFFADDPVRAYTMPFSFPRLYLAAGVTTIRTAGAFEPYIDLEMKKSIDAGKTIGPKMNVTGPYLDGETSSVIQLHRLNGPDDAKRTVNYWADEGVESFKVYADITRAELEAATAAAHKRGLTITGHLCSIGFREAAEIGMDSVEHGLFVDTEFAADKKPDVCPRPWNAVAADLDIKGGEIQTTIRVLVDHKVAVTSTLPAWEEMIAPRRDPSERVLRALSPDARKAYLDERSRLIREAEDPHSSSFAQIQRYKKMIRKEMEFEKAFVEAGGLLLAGSDCAVGGDIAGFGDHLELELLVEAGFSPVEAITIASLNGARFLKRSERIGSLAAGKDADVVLVKGDPSTNIRDIEKVEIVFKDGVGYDSKKLIDSVTGLVGIR